jgi:peroxiredoxin
MKKWILASATFLIVLTTQAQKDTLYPFQRYPTLPPISLIQTDSSMLKKAQLKKEPVLLMFFSPSCDHCQHQIKDMLKRMDEFKNTQFVLATYQPFEEMVAFYNEYELAKYPNVKVGRDTTFMLPPFYHMESLPFLALYDKKGNLLKTFEGNVKVDTLLKAFQ